VWSWSLSSSLSVSIANPGIDASPSPCPDKDRPILSRFGVFETAVEAVLSVREASEGLQLENVRMHVHRALAFVLCDRHDYFMHRR